MRNDLISRQAAIDAIDRAVTKEAARWSLQELPSAERHGRWNVRYNPGTGWYRITCSECGEDVTSTAPCIGFLPDAKVIWDYCPNCGARMEAE